MGRIIVNHRNFEESLEELLHEEYLGLDTETRGLHAYLGHRLFSIIVTSEKHSYYFNFNAMPDHTGKLAPTENILPVSWLDDFKTLFNRTYITWFIHNAKFDLHMLGIEGLFIRGTVVCTEMLSRIINNRLPSYSLANMGALIGYPKDDTVEKYISKHKLYTNVDVGKKKPRKDKHYDLVPFEIISEYGLTDGEVVYKLGMYGLKRLKELDEEQTALGLPSIMGVYRNEVNLTKVLFAMERVGTKIDKAYVKEAYEYEVEKREEYADKFYAYTGEEFQDAAACFKKVFEKLGLEAGKTPKGNPSYSVDNLPNNPVTELILGWRHHNKRAGTYWKNYLDLADSEDVVHCNFRQAGTVTGRMSSFDPNLQNVPKRGEDKSKYPVRRAFIPREGYFLCMVDFDQMEYRLLLDVANEIEVIRQIKEEGLDVHTATANTMRVERDPAKTLNFMLLYGGGAAKLAAALKVTLAKAKQYKNIYFRSLRRVQGLVKALQAKAKQRGYITNWLGRRLILDELKPYAMPNHYIQGGCGDVCKMAMVAIHDLLKPHESRMLLQVHDEIIIEIKKGEEFLIQKIKYIMENTYPSTNLQLTAGADYSLTDWHNKGAYNGETFNVT